MSYSTSMLDMLTQEVSSMNRVLVELLGGVEENISVKISG